MAGRRPQPVTQATNQSGPLSSMQDVIQGRGRLNGANSYFNRAGLNPGDQHPAARPTPMQYGGPPQQFNPFGGFQFPPMQGFGGPAPQQGGRCPTCGR